MFFTWVVRGAADTVSMWDAVERVASFATQIPSELSAQEQARFALMLRGRGGSMP